MIYRSNLVAPDLAPYFKLHEFAHYGGHTFLGDPDFEPTCGFFTHDEAALLYTLGCAVTRFTCGESVWLDIGARTGWTAAHLIAAGACVVALEPEYYRQPFRQRTLDNIGPVRDKYAFGHAVFLPWAMRSKEYFEGDHHATRFDGFVIDGNHDEPEPLRDVENCLKYALDSAVFVIHDFLGPATWQAAEYLLEHNCRCRVYWTANAMAVCVRGFDGWQLPEHHPDPEIVRMHRPRVQSGFDLRRCK